MNLDRCLCRTAMACGVAACLAIAAPAHAQRISVVLKGGAAVDSLRVSTPGRPTIAGQNSTGFLGGLSLRLPADRRLGLQVEFLVNERTPISASPMASDDKAALAVVPLLLWMRVHGDERLRVGVLAGTQVALQTIRRDTEEDVTDYAVILGVDAEWSRFIADFRYTRGLVTLERVGVAQEAVANRGFSLMAGWRVY